ncbi:hypothetical protein DL93DRAFT_2161737 [Clavulina sp. PMI_390]|nr:hypothetical protein DL93DRAFT_2161737 [Clavulina sp. PMI_390]
MFSQGMERVKKLVLRRILSPPLPKAPRARGNGQANTLCLSTLPEDVIICILCHAATEPRHLVVVGQTCRRLYEISFAELPWVKLWHRLAERGVLPPIQPPIYERPLHGEPCSQKTVFTPLPNWRFGLDSDDSRVHSTRCRIQRILEAQRRLHAPNHKVSALQIAQPLVDFPPNNFVAMAMTAGGEVLVVWMVSGLFVFDLEYGTRFSIHFAHETQTIDRAQIPRMATAIYRYNGSVGVLIAGKFTNSSTLSVLYQEIPRHGTLEDVPNCVTLLDISTPPLELTSRIQITAGYLIFITIITTHSYSEVHALSLSSERVVKVVNKDPRVIQAAHIISNKLFLGFRTGHVGEHNLERTSEYFTSSSYSLHSPDQRFWGHWHYMASEPLKDHNYGNRSLHFSRWSLQHSSPGCLASRLGPACLSSDCSIHPAQLASKPAEITLNTSHFAVTEPTLSSNPRSAVSRIGSAFWGERKEFSHQRSLAGHSALLSQLRATDTELDVFILSHTPKAGSNGGRGPQPGPWVTYHKTVVLETKSFTSSTKQQEYTRDFLWNEWTGRIAIASVNATTGMLSICFYQM